MHVRWSTRLTWVVVASGFFWLLIMFTHDDRLPDRGWWDAALDSGGAGVTLARRLPPLRAAPKVA